MNVTESPGDIEANMSPIRLAETLLANLIERNHVSVGSGQGLMTAAELDILEQKLLTAVSAVRTLHNSYSPVQRLLPETLAYIFTMVQEESPPFLPMHRYNRDVYSWMSVTQVCRFWRNTGLSHAALWSSIHSFQKNAIRLSLVRSMAAPLKVYFYSGRYDPCPALEDTEILDAVGANCARMKEFHLRQLCSHSLRATILSYFCFPAPHLESLSIALDDEDDPTSPVLPLLFTGHTPSLKQLNIRYFTSWAPANDFTNLTHICLYHQSETGRRTMAEFLDFLTACPLLEELVLIDAGPSVNNLMLATQPDRLVDLKHLRVFDIGLWQSAFTIGSLLSHLIIPRTTELSIWGRNIMRDEETLISLFPEFSPQRNNLSDITHLRITDSNTFGRSFPFITIRAGALQVNGSFQPEQALLAILDICSLAQVTELWLGDRFRPDPTQEQWHTFFLAMPSLTTLVIARRLSEPILCALIYDDEESCKPLPALLCPNLDSIRIHAYDTASVSALFLSVLVRQRADRGKPFQHLRVSIFELSPCLKNEIMYLKKMVATVECDGEYEEQKKLELLEGWPTSAYEWTKCENFGP